MALRPPLSKGLPLSVPLLLSLLGGGPPIGLFCRPLDPLRTFKRMAASCVTCSGGLGGDGLVKPGATTLRPKRAPLRLAAGPMLCYPELWGGWSASGSGLDSLSTAGPSATGTVATLDGSPRPVAGGRPLLQHSSPPAMLDSNASEPVGNPLAGREILGCCCEQRTSR